MDRQSGCLRSSLHLRFRVDAVWSVSTKESDTSMTIHRAALLLTALALFGHGMAGCDSAGCSGPPEGFSIDAPKPLAGTMRQTCHLGDDGLECWGVATRRSPQPPEAPLRQINGSTAKICGVDDQGKIRCWGARPFVAQPERAVG